MSGGVRVRFAGDDGGLREERYEKVVAAGRRRTHRLRPEARLARAGAGRQPAVDPDTAHLGERNLFFAGT